MKAQLIGVLFMGVAMESMAMEPDATNLEERLIRVYLYNKVPETELKACCYKYSLYNREKYFWSEEYKTQNFDVNGAVCKEFNIRPDQFGLIDIQVPHSKQVFTWVYYWRAECNALRLHKMGTKFMDSESVTIDLTKGLDWITLILKGVGLQKSFAFYQGMPDKE